MWGMGAWQRHCHLTAVPRAGTTGTNTTNPTCIHSPAHLQLPQPHTAHFALLLVTEALIASLMDSPAAVKSSFLPAGNLIMSIN